MRFSTSQEKILAALQNVQNAIPTRSTLPILSNILLEAFDNKLKISATDLDMSITVSIPLVVNKKGSLSVPAKQLLEIIREAPAGDIEFLSAENRLEFKLKTGEYKMGGIAAEEYPKLPEATGGGAEVSSADLVRMVRKSTFAISADETRPALNGALWKAEGDEMLMVATDGHRLAKVSRKNKKYQGLAGEVIVPPKILRLIEKILGEEEKPIRVVFKENSVSFEIKNTNSGDIFLSSRLIEGPYPNFEQVIPKDNPNTLIIDKALLSSTVRRVSILSNNITRQIKFSLSPKTLEISAANFDIAGEGKETIPCDYVGNKMELGYNASYILEILKEVDGEQVTFKLGTNISAGIVFPNEKKEDEDYFFLVMPLRLAD